MKYSIIMPYYNRLNQLQKTLRSFMSFYHDRDDFEVIIVGDQKHTVKQLNDLFNVIDIFRSKLKIIYILSEVKKATNPSTAYNEGADIARGEYIVLTSPECQHTCDILGGFDTELQKNTQGYVVCGCMALNKNGTFHKWFQHSKERNSRYHFCSVIRKDLYKKINGFDDRFTYGIAYDDNVFLQRVLNNRIKIKTRDDLLVHHLWHEKNRPNNYRKLLNRNKKLYEKEYN